MADEVEIIEQLQSFVCDLSQVVTYKWVSRKFSLSSNAAKGVLRKFCEEHSDGVEIIYVVSGWTKLQPSVFSVQLVPKQKLQGAKAALLGNPSSHVYSVQAFLPKDSAQLWSADFVESEELFNQPPHVNNSLRDNRFSAVCCSYVKRDLKVKKAAAAEEAAKEQPSTSATNSKLPKEETSKSATTEKKDSAAVETEKTETETAAAEEKKQVPKKKKDSGSGAKAFTNLWDRPPKPTMPPQKQQQQQLSNEESVLGVKKEESDDDVADFVRLRKGTLKKRRVIDDDDDEEEEEEEEENKVSNKSELACDDVATEIENDEQKKDKCEGGDDGFKLLLSKSKKRKIFRKRIDERGREVTEVLLEVERGEEEKEEEKEKEKEEAKRPKPNPNPNPNPNPKPKSKMCAKSNNSKGGKQQQQQGSITSFFKKKN